MNAFEINKIVGAVLATALIASVISIAGNILVPEGDEKDGENKAAATTGTKPGAATAAPKPAPAKPLAVLLAQGKLDAGRRGAKACASCHTLTKGGANKIGPNLYGIIGRKLGSVSGYSYSAGLKGTGGSWSYASLFAFLKKPGAFVKGTKMSFRVRKPQARANLLLYLRTLSDTPAPLPEPPPAKTGGGTEKKAEAVKKTTAEKTPAETPKKEALPAVSVDATLAAGDAARGTKIAKRKCLVCHTVVEGGSNKIGPNLYGIVGRARASYPDFRYSAAMKAKGGAWSAADLFAFLAGPQKFVKGTNMPVKVRNPAERADIIAYLKTLSSK